MHAAEQVAACAAASKLAAVQTSTDRQRTCPANHICPGARFDVECSCLPGARALTVAALNEKLDEIVRAASNSGKKEILRYLMHM